MKAIIVCLTGILMCSCCTTIDDSMKRRDEISKIMKDHFHNNNFDYGFKIEGPFTIKQFKEHYVKRHVERFGISEENPGKLKELLDRIKEFPDSQKFNDFVRPVVSHKGNKLYFFISDIDSWGALNGREGYVIIYKNEIVDIMVIGIS